MASMLSLSQRESSTHTMSTMELQSLSEFLNESVSTHNHVMF